MKPNKPSPKRKGPKKHLDMNHAEANRLGVVIQARPAAPLLSPNDAAKLLGVTGAGIKQWIRTGKLPAIKTSNGYWHIAPADLEAAVLRRTETPRKRVLLYAQNPDLRQRLAKIFADQDVNLIAPNSLTDALLKLAQLNPNALLLAADEGGWSLAQKARQTAPLRGSPVVLVAERDLSDEETARALDLRIQGFQRLVVGRPIAHGQVRLLLQSLSLKV